MCNCDKETSIKKYREEHPVAFWVSFSIVSVLLLIIIILFIKILVKK
jgi:hypothetical protein